MEFKYAHYIDTDFPEMLIYEPIGWDAELGMGIIGQDFAEELKYLDTLGKKKICIRINSPGGSVDDGLCIFSSILAMRNTPVDCYNDGLAASTAGWIFCAGRNRYMLSYANLMMHRPYIDGKPTENDLKALAAIENTIAIALSSRSGKSVANILYLMGEETWFDAGQAVKEGFATEILEAEDYNTNEESVFELSGGNLMDAWKISSKILNSGRYIQSTGRPDKKEKQDLQMNKNLAKALGLPEDATEEQVLKAVNKLNKKSGIKNDEECDPDEEEEDPEMDAVKKKMDKFGKAIDDCQGKMSDLADKHKDLMEEHKSLKAAHDEFGKVFTDLGKRVSDLEKSKDDSSMTYDAAAIELVNRFVSRIGNDASKILDWTRKAAADMKKTEAELEALPINMKSLAVEAQTAVAKDRDTRPTMNMSPAVLAEWYSANARKKAAAKK